MAEIKKATIEKIPRDKKSKGKTKSGEKETSGESGKQMFVKTDMVARMFGVTVRRVQQLTQEGVLHTIRIDEHSARRYELETTVREYVTFLSDKAYKKNEGSNSKQLKEQKLQAEVDLKRTQSELSKIRKDIVIGRYLLVDDVRRDYEKFFSEFKRFVFTIPPRVGGIVAGYVEPTLARTIESDITKDVTNALTGFVVNQGGGSDKA